MSTKNDDDRTVVKTYVPAYQKEKWREHADDLEMSQSEFVRSMVQAGRRGFDTDLEPAAPNHKEETPRVDDLEDQVLDVLREGHYSWDELIDLLTKNVEDRLEETLQRLQRDNRIQYNGRKGGYTTADSS